MDDEWDIFQLKMHPCRDEELSRFYPPADKATETKVNRLKEAGNLFCIDWDQANKKLYGSEIQGLDFAVADPSIFPCASRVTLQDGS